MRSQLRKQQRHQVRRCLSLQVLWACLAALGACSAHRSGQGEGPPLAGAAVTTQSRAPLLAQAPLATQGQAPLLAQTPLATQGQALFFGQAPLTGKVRGNRDELPPEVVTCSNCHALKDGTNPPSSNAPRIDRLLLTEPHQRRGGPPSSYDAPAFCQLLRTGVDPAYVLIAREMPTYSVNDVQCDSLWRFLIGA